METQFYRHEQEVAKGWDFLDGQTELTEIMKSHNYSPEVNDIIEMSVQGEESFAQKYPEKMSVIRSMTQRRKKGRDRLTAMKEICISFINKDTLAELFRMSGVDVRLFDKNGREINRVSKVGPDFVMTRPALFGKTRRNVKVTFTNRKMTNQYLLPEDKFVEYANHDTRLLVLNTNTRQYTVIDFGKLKGKEVKTVYTKYGMMCVIRTVTGTVSRMDTDGIIPIVEDIFR